MTQHASDNPRAYHKMSAKEQIFLLNLIREGKTTTEITRLCERCTPPFSPSIKVVDYWRNKTKNKYMEIIKGSHNEVWSEGLAKSEERVKVLKMLAERLLKDLAHGDAKKEKVWLDNMKSMGNRAPYAYKEFNGPEFSTLRGIMNDIALEVGDRNPKKFERESASEISRLSSLPADIIAPSFLGVYRDIKDRRHMEYLLEGGRGSTKSSFTSLVIIYLMVNNPEIHVLAMRQVANTLRDSVYSQLLWAIGILGLESQFKCTTSPLEIEYLPTHQKIYFRGADKPEMIKSIKPIFGYIGVLWFEELDQFHGPEAIRKIEQSTLRGGALAWEFKTYNPPRTAANWVNRYALIPKENQLHHHSDYLSVPVEWLGKTFIDEAEHLKKVNEKAYNHELLGMVVGTGGQIFDNLVVRKITKEEREEFESGRVLRGIDWGFFPDPFSYGKMFYNPAQMKLYIWDEYRANRKSNKDVYEYLVEEKGLQPNDLIIADSAEPKSIADLREYGASIRAAEKGPESIKYSYKWLQSLAEIVVDPVDAPMHAQEFGEAEMEQTKDGEYISEYPDKNNHSIDDARYATNPIWRKRGQ
jgi:phage terminase large subunit